MRKLFLFVLSVSFAFSLDFLVGANYGFSKLKSQDQNGTFDINNLRGLSYRVGLGFNGSRLLLSYDNPNISNNREFTMTSLSWNMIDDTDPYVRGFFGIGVAQVAYKDTGAKKIDESGNALGLELGIILLEDGDWLKHLEMEIGYKFYTGSGLQDSDKLGIIKEFHSGYVGFNLKF